MFDVARLLRSGLVSQVDHHLTLGSTSDRALELAARDQVPLPLLVLTEQQLRGRGRGTNRWWWSAGALTFSLAFDAMRLAADRRALVSIAGGLAVCEALAELAPRGDWHVKWPNDVFAGGKKACGILCESVPGWPERLVVGIGINVNNAMDSDCRLDDRKPGTCEQLPKAVALVEIDNVARDLTEVLLAVLDRFEWRWSQLVAGKFTELATAYRERCLLTGKMVTVSANGDRLMGKCRGIDGRGALVLATESGSRSIVAGNIEAWE